MTSPIYILCCSMIFAKEMVAGPIQCSGCGDCHRHTRHGVYERYLPDSTERVKVQRYRCLNPDCSCVTFSILPCPCLRYKRHTLATFGQVVMQAATKSVSRLAQLYAKGWSSMRRMIRASQQIWACFESERRCQLWGPCPCREPARYWTSFTLA